MTAQRRPRKKRYDDVRRLVFACFVLFAVLPCAAAGAEIDPTFTSEPYGNPIVTSGSDGTTIAVPEPPGGMYYRVALDPARTYRVRLHGARSGGRFVLRLRSDEDVPVYTQLPDGVETYRVSGTEQFEMLLFRDSESDDQSYLVRSLEIEACEDCPTDDDLKREILDDLPQLDETIAQGDDYQAAVMLLDWASPRITGSSGGPEPIAADFRSAAELYYDFFQPGTGGVYCGGAADFLKKLLDLFAIPSFRLDFGDVSWFTHVAVVVPVHTDVGVSYRLIDPTFGTHYIVSATGAPISIEQMLELWRADRMDVIEIHAVGLGIRQLVVGGDRTAGTVDVMPCAAGSNLSTLCGLSSFTAIQTPLFSSHGYTADLEGMLRLLGTTDLLYPDYTGVPEQFRERHATFKRAVEEGDTSVRIAELPLPPAVGQDPTIRGAAQVGAQLSLDMGSWRSPGPITFVHQWQRCSPDSGTCQDIPETTASTYTVGGSDVGYRLRARVSAANEYGRSPEAVTALTEPAAAAVPEAPGPGPVDRPERLADVSVRWLRASKRLRVRVLPLGPSRLHAVARLYLRRHGRNRVYAVARFHISPELARRVHLRVPPALAKRQRRVTLVLHLWNDQGDVQVLRRRVG